MWLPLPPNWFRHKQQLSVPTNFNTFELFADGMEVDEARNWCARACLDHDPRPTFLWFLDYDVLVPWDALTKLCRYGLTGYRHAVRRHMFFVLLIWIELETFFVKEFS